MTDIRLTEKNVGILTIDTWPQWSRRCKAALRAGKVWTYIEGYKRDAPTEKGEILGWAETNDQIVGALCQVVEDSLAQEIEHFTSASKAWQHLKMKTYNTGTHSKFNALQSAMRLRIDNTNSVSTVITELKDYMEVIYSDEAPTKDEWMAGILLHSMNNGDFENLRKILMVSSSTLTSADIIQRLEAEARETRHREQIKNGDTILAAKQKTRNNKPVKCTNCNKTSHTVEKCWEKGGGSEGKGPEWWKEAKERRRKEKTKERAHAAISDVSDSNSGSESCTILQDLTPTHSDCSIDWSNTIATAEESPPYFLDSGATSHCSPNRDDFLDLCSIPPRKICGINGTSIAATAVGTIKIRCGKGRRLTLHNALYIPNAKLRLISIGRLGDMGITATFTASTCSILRGSRTIAKGTRTGTSLYQLNDTAKIEHALLARAPPDLDTWHRRLGHVNYSSIVHMAERGLVSGMPANLSTIPPTCEHCVLGKQTRTPVPKVREGERAKHPLDKVFSDISGPEDVQTTQGGLYTLNFIDDFSQKTWVYILKHKAEALTHFKEWKAIVEREMSHTVKTFRTDNGGEYTSQEFEKYLKNEGITHQTTAPHTSAQNGKAERLHRTLFNRAHAIMSENKFPSKLWGECILTAAYLKDRTPTRTLKDITPYEAYYGSKPNISHLREIGCKAFVLVQSERRRKIYSRSIESVLVGYSTTSKAYRCYYPTTGRIIVSRHVSFIEAKDMKSRPYRPGVSIGTDESDTDPLEHHLDEDQLSDENMDTEENAPNEPHGTTLCRSTRPKKPSAAAAEIQGIPHESSLEKAKREIKEKSAENSEEQEQIIGIAHDDPRTYRQAMQAYDAECWDKSYDDEMASISQHGVWTLVPRSSVPKGHRIVGSRPVFFRKRDEHNEVSRRKVRVVAKGYSQVEGLDYTDTFAPVSRLESVRTVLGIAASLDWEIHQFDVKTAFLHGNLTEEIYMEQPDGRKEKGKEDYVCKLHKSLYGLRQAGRCWYERLCSEMKKAGFERASVDHSVFTKCDSAGDAMVTVHVDDMAVATSNKEMMTNTYHALKQILNVVDMGEIHWFLGMAITRDRKERTISLSQTAFIDTILKRFKMEDCYGVTTPLDPDVVLSKAMSPTSDKEKARMKHIPYLAGVGSLMYTSLATRPDITFATNKLSQYNMNPGQAHWTALQRVLRYLKRTRDHVLTLGGKGDITLLGYTDSDFASCIDTRRSTSGYAFTLGSGAVSWSSKRQSLVTTSTCEAEYVASCHATKEAMWLRRLLETLGHKQSTTTMHSDNAGSITLTKDATYHARSKHIDVQFHYTRERVDDKDVSFHYLPSHDMPADMLTKALPRPKHEKFTHLLGVRPPNNTASQ